MAEYNGICTVSGATSAICVTSPNEPDSLLHRLSPKLVVMKFLVLSVFLCTLVAASTAQSTIQSQMQSALGNMLALVRDMSVANKGLINDTEDQMALNSGYMALEELYQLFSVFGTANSSSLPLPSRTRLNNAFSTFQNAVAGWESALDPRTPDNLSSTFKTVENAFLGFAGVVFSL